MGETREAMPSSAAIRTRNHSKPVSGVCSRLALGHRNGMSSSSRCRCNKIDAVSSLKPARRYPLAQASMTAALSVRSHPARPTAGRNTRAATPPRRDLLCMRRRVSASRTRNSCCLVLASTHRHHLVQGQGHSTGSNRVLDWSKITHPGEK